LDIISENKICARKLLHLVFCFIFDYNALTVERKEINMKKFGLIGAGIWGTSLALTCARAGCEVLAWAKEEDVIY